MLLICLIVNIPTFLDRKTGRLKSSKLDIPVKYDKRYRINVALKQKHLQQFANRDGKGKRKWHTCCSTFKKENRSTLTLISQ